MDWTELLLKKEPLNVFFEKAPALNDVRILEVIINEDEPCLTIRLDLNEFPENPPSKWDAGYNTVQIILEFIDISDLTLKGWSTNNFVTFKLEKSNEKILVEIYGDSTNIKFLSSFINLQKLSAYCDETRE